MASTIECGGRHGQSSSLLGLNTEWMQCLPFSSSSTLQGFQAAATACGGGGGDGASSKAVQDATHM